MHSFRNQPKRLTVINNYLTQLDMCTRVKRLRSKPFNEFFTCLFKTSISANVDGPRDAASRKSNILRCTLSVIIRQQTSIDSR